jgi:HTH-type transcriptional regulator/antitoxin HigA
MIQLMRNGFLLTQKLLKINAMKWKVLKTAKDYEKAAKRMMKIFHTEEEGALLDELELLIVLIKDYDDRHYAYLNMDPLQVIILKMNEMGIKSKDLVPLIGSKGHVSAVLSGKREITLKMAQRLREFFQLPAEVFI